MSDCSVIRERIPELLTESLDSISRESAHRHIEACPLCETEWTEQREVWRLMGELPDLAVPPSARAGFLSHVVTLQPAAATVVPFRRREPIRWMAQAAVLTLVTAGAFYGGRKTVPVTAFPALRPAAAIAKPFSIAESMVFPASEISPAIEGRPAIENVRFTKSGAGPDQMAVSFDITSHMTITGNPDDRSLVTFLSYVMQNQDHSAPSRSNTIQWVKQTYAGRGVVADPEIVKALANVLRNDAHEGVRIKAVETLTSLPPELAGDVRAALVAALRNDPNPAVRIKAVEGLANLAHVGEALDAATVNTLREKASQGDENLYVRVKAAEALGQIKL